ncbi:MAG: vWA domain-containing protein [Campylobacterota bacterium]|nr:vWA domain-containing protein [Campylobacterota bacterium]
MKKTMILLSVLLSAQLFASDLKLPPILEPNTKVDDALPQGKFIRTGPTIQIAILLDTSNSMDGLITQVKEQIWNIVNEVSRANKNSQDITMQVALYEYGKNTLPAHTGYIQMLSPLTNDLDFLSEKLFALKTRGGLEYAGEVIEKASNNLYWSKNRDDLRIIIIAGNEEFDQGSVNYRQSIANAKKRDIVVNTIFCGPHKRGIYLGWEDGAKKGGGKYMNIDSDRRVVHIPTPQDSQIIILNNQLNSTYIGYGQRGKEKKQRQLKEDEKSKNLSIGSYVSRTVSKSSRQYKTESWDAVSSYDKGNKSIAKELKQSNIAFSDKSEEEIDKIVAAKSEDRKKIKSEIQELEKKRRLYIKNNQPKGEQTFGERIIKEIKSQMEESGFSFKSSK